MRPDDVVGEVGGSFGRFAGSLHPQDMAGFVTVCTCVFGLIFAVCAVFVGLGETFTLWFGTKYDVYYAVQRRGAGLGTFLFLLPMPAAFLVARWARARRPVYLAILAACVALPLVTTVRNEVISQLAYGKEEFGENGDRAGSLSVLTRECRANVGLLYHGTGYAVSNGNLDISKCNQRLLPDQRVQACLVGMRAMEPFGQFHACRKVATDYLGIDNWPVFDSYGRLLPGAATKERMQAALWNRRVDGVAPPPAGSQAPRFKVAVPQGARVPAQVPLAQ